MDHLLPAAPWLMALAAAVSAAACVGAWRAVPWQGRQSALIMAAAMLALAVADGDPGTGLVLGGVLLVSAMLGTVGVRGTPAAAMCCHRALVSLVMALCAFEGAASNAGTPTSGHAHGAGLSGVLPALVLVGVIGVVLWTVVAERLLPPRRHDRRTARLLAVESWAMAAGAIAMCLGF